MDFPSFDVFRSRLNVFLEDIILPNSCYLMTGDIQEVILEDSVVPVGLELYKYNLRAPEGGGFPMVTEVALSICDVHEVICSSPQRERQ